MVEDRMRGTGPGFGMGARPTMPDPAGLPSAGVQALGTRSIRSAGHGSGSIEVTLPATLKALQGLPCRIALRDGHRPEIVLQPDFRPARDAFARLHAALQRALDLDIEEWSPTDHGMALRPAAAQLAWEDGLALAAAAPHPADAVARSLRGLGQRLALRVAIGADFAAGFGAALGWTLTGRVPDPGDQAACDIAAFALAASAGAASVGVVSAGVVSAGAAATCSPGALVAGAEMPALAAAPPPFAGDAWAAEFWDGARPRLRRLLALHRSWTTDPDAHAALVAAWQRGVALELHGD